MRQVHGNTDLSSRSREWLVAAAAFRQQFVRDERGTTAVVFGLMFTVLLLAIGMTIDYSRSVDEQARIQWALDASVLAASNKIGQVDQETAGREVANKFLAQNLPPGSAATIDSLTFSPENGSVFGTISSYVPMTVMRVFGKEQLDVNARSTVVKGNATIELVMVLDNSGSMRDDMPTLRDAASGMTDIVFAGEDGSGKVKVGLVPFSASVKVGSSYQNSGWVDTDGLSSLHRENFNVTGAPQTYTEARDVDKTRMQLFSDLNTTWAGCVESRPGALDTNDTPPSNANGDTLFVPMFAPDEPDDDNSYAAGYGDTYANNYISDYGGTCPVVTRTCLEWNRRGTRCLRYAPLPPIDVASAQARTCKYSNAPIIDGTGPNYSCSSTLQPIQDLSADLDTVKSAITSLVHGGNTNIGEGTMWGWRVLSPNLPFTEGRSYSDGENKKIMVVMTDGQNTYSDDNSKHNNSQYGASGYATRGRLGATMTEGGFRQSMNAKLTAACTNAKASGITIYTVAFRLENDAATQALLRSCATSTSNYYAASNTSALIQSFQTIGRDIADLRLSY